MSEWPRSSAIGARAERIEHEDDLSRRQFLATTLMNGTSLAIGTTLVGMTAARHSRTHHASAHAPEAPHELPKKEEWPGTEVMPEAAEGQESYVLPPGLAGKHIAGLERTYLGLDGPEPFVRLPERMPAIDFSKNIHTMLEEKKGIISGAADAAEQRAAYTRLEKSYDRAWKEGTVRRMDLPTFRTLIQNESYAMLNALEGAYPRISETYFAPHLKEKKNLTPEQVEAFQTKLANTLRFLAQHITPDVMLAYITTELMPATERGVPLLAFLIEHAGVEFLERIPALGDRELSYGPLQLTRYVVGEGGSVTNLQEVMGREDLVPADLADFSSIEDHLRAGFLFAFHNLLTLVQDAVKTGNYEDILTLCEGAADGGAGSGNRVRSTVFLEYLASAHHRPLVARETMKHWLTHNRKHAPADRAKTLVSSFDKNSAGREVKAYAQKAEQYFGRLVQPTIQL